jgi:riboflavin synthase
MFSGLIEHGGIVESLEAVDGGARLRVRLDGVPRAKAEAKDSIAVNGVCLTVTQVDGDVITFDVIPETLASSTLSEITAGERVNLETALRVGDAIGGHFVYGHADAAVRVIARKPEGQGARLRVALPAGLAACVPAKAFVAVDGVSLTVANAGKDWFEVALIPETLRRTTLGARPAGSRVNLEVDPLSRYVAAALGKRPSAKRSS